MSKFPKELTDKKNWVVAKKGSKIPLNPMTLKGASSSDPKTWGTYGVAKYIEDVSLGYVFSNDGIVGIDIDKGFDDFGLPTDLSLDIINRCKSYTEISRSGRGFHIFVKGKLPFKGRNNREGVEIYQEGRYFIMTGNIIFDNNQIIENQEAIDYILEKYFSKEIKDLPKRHNQNYIKTGNNIYETKVEFINGKIITTYPSVGEGGRNISLLSFAGQLVKKGLSDKEIFDETLNCNYEACIPPLSISEVERIVESALRYR